MGDYREIRLHSKDIDLYLESIMTNPWPSNKELLKLLDKEIYGHQEAKKALITALNRSYLRYHQRHVLGMPIEDCVSNRNVLLIGASGTGKTALVLALQKIMNFPMKEVSATELTQQSSTGTTVKNILDDVHYHCRTLSTTKNSIFKNVDEAAARYVVYVDEIDKISKFYDGSTNGKWNLGTQTNFLKLFENAEGLDSVTFIFSGAFTGMLEAFQPEKPKQLGFFHAPVEDKEHVIDYQELIIKYGLLPELVGRMHVVVGLEQLKKEHYHDIINTYILPKKKEELKHFGVTKLKLDKKTKEELIDKAIKSGQGVRSLIKSIDSLCMDHEFDSDLSLLKK